MATGQEYIFVIQLFLSMGIIIYQLYSLGVGFFTSFVDKPVREDEIKKLLIQFSMFISYIILVGFSFVVTATTYTTPFYGLVLTYQSWFILVSFMFVIIQLFVYFYSGTRATLNLRSTGRFVSERK